MKKICFILLSAIMFACSDRESDVTLSVAPKVESKAVTDSKKEVKMGPWSFWLSFNCFLHPYFITVKGDVYVEEDTGDNIVYAGSFQDFVRTDFAEEFSVVGTLDYNSFVQTPMWFVIKNFKMRFEYLEGLSSKAKGVRVTWYSFDDKKLFSFDVPASEIDNGIDYEWVDMPDLYIVLPDDPSVIGFDYDMHLEPWCRIEEI